MKELSIWAGIALLIWVAGFFIGRPKQGQPAQDAGMLAGFWLIGAGAIFLFAGAVRIAMLVIEAWGQ